MSESSMLAGLSLLVVEDDAAQCRLVSEILRDQGYRIASAGSAEQAGEILSDSGIDLVLSDWRLPGRDGLELLQEVREKYPQTAFVMVTAYGSISHAVQAIRLGADDYLAKPYERQSLLLAIERTLRARELLKENMRLSQELSERDRLVDLVGSSSSMQKLYRQVDKLAATEATVLLSGESGTGKELTARALHVLSGRHQGPFVAVNCGAIPEGLMESEFFGAARGAYTGADRSRIGLFEAASGGTLFLDEIAELPLALQPRLLRVLQESRVTRIGENQERPIDVRIIAATNRDLSEEMAEGRFREDLYYRLSVVPIVLPPLRERREDIALLVEHFRSRTGRRHGRDPHPIPKAVLRRLLDYPWPGNVRELGNVVERLLLLADESGVNADDLPASFARTAKGGGQFTLPPNGLSWEEHEKDVLRQALALTDGNRSRSAKLLDLPYKAFLYRLDKYGLA